MIGINSYYSIFAGIIKVSKKEIVESKLLKDFHSWENRLFEGNYEATLKHLSNNYYDSFLLGMLPTLLDEQTRHNSKYLRRYTRKSLSKQKAYVLLNEEKVHIFLEYFDLYFFPNGLALYYFKIKPVKNPSLENIPLLIYDLRMLKTKLYFDDKELSINDWILEQIGGVIQLKKDWNNYTPQLKSYTILDIDKELSEKQNDELLFDLATLSPIGTAGGTSMNSPSPQYFNDIIEKYKISVFKNWSGLSLFDTFTMVSFNKSDSFRAWEYDYLNVYLMAIYIKGFIYLANTTLSDVTVANKKSELVKNTFIEFINDYYITNISYRFLPNILNEKMILGLDVPVEISKMESKINRLNDTIKRNIDNRLNITILILAIFSIFSVITDLSDWLSTSIESKSWLYPYAGILALIVFIIILFVTINYSKLRRND